MIIGATFVVGAAKADDYYETTIAGIETGIKNLKDKKKKSEYIKIFKTKGKKAMLNAMAREFDGAGSGISDFSKKLFVIYGATDEIRSLYTEKRINAKGEVIDMLTLDKYMPEYMKDLWAAQQTSQNLNKISRYLGSELADKDYFSISKENREKYRTMAEPDLTINKEFYAFGKTRLYQSVYGSVKSLENGKYDVDSEEGKDNIRADFYDSVVF